MPILLHKKAAAEFNNIRLGKEIFFTKGTQAVFRSKKAKRLPKVWNNTRNAGFDNSEKATAE